MLLWPPVLTACSIVLHPDDDMDKIFDTLRQAVLLQQAGAGLGFPLSLLRPTGFPTHTSEATASGPMSFLGVFDNAFGVIKQQVCTTVAVLPSFLIAAEPPWGQHVLL